MRRLPALALAALLIPVTACDDAASKGADAGGPAYRDLGGLGGQPATGGQPANGGTPATGGEPSDRRSTDGGRRVEH